MRFSQCHWSRCLPVRERRSRSAVREIWSAQKNALPFGGCGVYSCMNMERSSSTIDLPLPEDVPTLQALIRELLDALKKEQHEREGVQQRLDLLLRKLYGPKAERFDPNQPWLLPELAPSATPTPNEKAPTQDDDAKESANGKSRPRSGGRKKIPANL